MNGACVTEPGEKPDGYLTCDIEVHKRTGIFAPGELLTGKVLVKIRQPLPISGVQLWILGQADISWAEKCGSKRIEFNYETYIQECLTLYETSPDISGQSSQQLSVAGTPLTPQQQQLPRLQPQLLPAGVHEFVFTYTLPSRLPSSFEVCGAQLRARVHYLLRAVVDYFSADDDIMMTSYQADKSIIVLQNLDLNRESDLMESAYVCKDEVIACTRCCGLCGGLSGGAVRCSVKLERTGFVPGEDINLDAEIRNHSNKEIVSSYVTMQQVTTAHFEGVSHKRRNTLDIFRISGGKIRPRDGALYHDIIHIPPLPPSRLEYCSIIDIEYVITVGLIPNEVAAPVELSIPILIGTVPLRDLASPGLTMMPTHSRYSQTSGEIEDYTETDNQADKHQNVYTYYRCVITQSDDHT